MKTYYYVVSVTIGDDGPADWDLDPYTEDDRFPDGTVWDDKAGEWQHHDSESNTAQSSHFTRLLVEALTTIGQQDEEAK